MSSRFDGGTRGNGRWDEEEHPRGKGGRFAVAGEKDLKNPDNDQNTARMKEKLDKIADIIYKFRKGMFDDDDGDNEYLALEAIEEVIKK